MVNTNILSKKDQLQIKLIQDIQLLNSSKEQVEQQQLKLEQLEKEISSYINESSKHCDLDCNLCLLNQMCLKISA